jgi:hypothetical protein
MDCEPPAAARWLIASRQFRSVHGEKRDTQDSRIPIADSALSAGVLRPVWLLICVYVLARRYGKRRSA